MDKIKINGEDWIKLEDICDILRSVKEEPIFDDTDKVIKMIAHLMFYEDVQVAGTDEDREFARELPGSFIVCRKVGHRRFETFQEWKGKDRPVFADSMNDGMVFTYESMADYTAEKLNKGWGEGWKTFCVGDEYRRIIQRFHDNLMAFLDRADEGEEDA